MRTSGAVLVVLGALLAPAGRARADVILSTLPGNDLGGAFLNAPSGGFFPQQTYDSKANGFTLPVGIDYALDAVQLRLTLFDRDAVPVVALYDTNSEGNPGAELITLINSDFSTLGSPTTYTFTPPAPFTLAAGATYWVVVSNAAAVPNSFLWLASTPPVTPTGIATSAGPRFSLGPPPPVGASTTFDSYAVHGTPAVPEPSAWLLGGLGALGLLGCARRRKRAARVVPA